jgi:crotonobetainyl-CoA:carnitine CoA-transferase CaiB-like acyl-CoA transferase
LKQLIDNDVPAAPLNTLDEVFDDPQVHEYGFPQVITHPKMGDVKMVGNAVDMSRTPPIVDKPPPVLGEHADEILSSLGYDTVAIEALRTNGIV